MYEIVMVVFWVVPWRRYIIEGILRHRFSCGTESSMQSKQAGYSKENCRVFILEINQDPEIHKHP